MEDFWHPNYALLDLLLDTDLSVPDIAKELKTPQVEVQKQIKDLGLSWIRRRDRKMSRGQAALMQITKRLLPGEEIINEYHIGEMLRLDIYIPKYKLCIEYHGRQHFEHIVRFHPTIDDYEKALKRDERKIELCKEQGITLVAFRYNDQLSEDIVHDRLLGAIRNSSTLDVIEKKPRNKAKLQTRNMLSTKNNPYCDQIKERRREYEKQMRDKIKEERKLKGRQSKL